jgi:hypothetical protein
MDIYSTDRSFGGKRCGIFNGLLPTFPVAIPPNGMARDCTLDNPNLRSNLLCKNVSPYTQARVG